MSGSTRRRVVAALAVLATCVSLTAVAGPAAATTGTTLLEASGAVAFGSSYGFTSPLVDAPPEVEFTGAGTPDHVTITGVRVADGRSWTLEFGAAPGQQLALGAYLEGGYLPVVDGYYADPKTVGPWMSFSGAVWGCGNLDAAFVVRDIAFDPDTGALLRFGATFDAVCGAPSPTLSGTILWNSQLSAAPRVTGELTGPDRVSPGGTVGLGGALAGGSGPLAGAPLSVLTHDSAGTHTLPAVTTAADGTYATSTTIGPSRTLYAVVFAGDGTHDAAVAVRGVGIEPWAATLTAHAPATLVTQVARITGHLATSQGPVAGATLHLTYRDDLPTPVEPRPDAVTDANGDFSTPVTVGYGDHQVVSLTYDGGGDNGGAGVEVPLDRQHLPAAISLSAPATGVRGRAYTVSGVVTSQGVPLPGARVYLTWRDVAGVHDRWLTASAGGTYSLRQVPTVGGPAVYQAVFYQTLSYVQALATPRSVTIARAATSLTATTDRAQYTYGATARVSVHLGTTYNSRSVVVYARALGVGKVPDVLVGKGTVDRLGNFSTTYRMLAPTAFVVRFLGDYRYDAAAKLLSSKLAYRVSRALVGPYSLSKGVYLVRRAVKPTLSIAVAPAAAGVCAGFVLQVFRNGAWQRADSLSCVALSSTSRAVVGIETFGQTGRFRVQASVAASRYVVGATTPWTYFTMT